MPQTGSGVARLLRALVQRPEVVPCLASFRPSWRKLHKAYSYSPNPTQDSVHPNQPTENLQLKTQPKNVKNVIVDIIHWSSGLTRKWNHFLTRPNRTHPKLEILDSTQLTSMSVGSLKPMALVLCARHSSKSYNAHLQKTQKLMTVSYKTPQPISIKPRITD